ncbi:MAG TPA: NBR1-Ig-like domain-containing protein [Anaerolineales bacterium]
MTIPDYSVVAPGSTLDKQWLVQNSGSCNWDSHYRLRLVSGNGLGASLEEALYPARAEMQATLRIIFTAPLEAGEYYSEWQAFDPKGIPFGEAFFIKIIVQ